jgi:UDP-N-acetylglucosamine 2-epimerase (non-hydrolysing)
VKVFLVAGARPNFMKVAPLVAAMRARVHRLPELEPLLVHSGQHYDTRMSDEFFRDLEMPEPDIHLGAGSGTHAEQTARVMVAFEKICQEHTPALVVVVGDVNSTLACALAAKKLGIAVAHVEAGLRSRDMGMPEEINRLCTDVISDFLFTTDRQAGKNLIREGCPRKRIYFVGNTMIDSLRRHLGRALAMPLPLGLDAGSYALMTLHRPSNVDDPDSLRELIGAMNQIAEQIPLLFPAHPRTAQRMAGITLHDRLVMIEPQGYLAFLSLMARARMVLTDSGGIQEETTVLHVPCLTLRENTERPITCTMGTNILAGTDPRNIVDLASQALHSPPPTNRIPAKWDGHAADRIADCLVDWLEVFRVPCKASRVRTASSHGKRVRASQAALLTP